VCRRIADRGFLCLSVDYRLSQEAVFPAAVFDCKAGVRYLRSHAGELGVSPDAIGVWGSSAGGYLAAILGTSAGIAALEGEGGWPEADSSVQAVCDWFGPTDFARMSAFPGTMDHDEPGSPESQFIGGPVQEHLDRVRAANPITYVGSHCPPFLIAHGRRDPLVPFNQSQLLHEALQSAGVPVEFHALGEAGHGGPDFFGNKLLIDACLAFLEHTLRGKGRVSTG
jgi:acetyl esterase/lipase